MERPLNIDLLPGFNLVSNYVKKKIPCQGSVRYFTPETEIYKHDPWDLPVKCNPATTLHNQWYFIVSRDRKNSSLNKTTSTGYWNVNGKEQPIKMDTQNVGSSKTSVFYKGCAPGGEPTDWIMVEYDIYGNKCETCSAKKDIFVLCRATGSTSWTTQYDNKGDRSNGDPQENNEVVASPVIGAKQSDCTTSIIADIPDGPAPNGDKELRAWMELMYFTKLNPSCSPKISIVSAHRSPCEYNCQTMRGPPEPGPNKNTIPATEILRVDEHQYILSAVSLFITINSQSILGLPNSSQGTTLRCIPVGMIGGSSMLALYVYLCSSQRGLSSVWKRFTGLEIYIISAIVVITAYGQLLLINMSYMSIFIIPVTILLFIAALCNKFSSKSRMKEDSSNKAKYGFKKVELVAITALPYFLLSFEVLMGNKAQHGSDILVPSHFFSFLSSALGAVAVMVSLLPVAVTPGGAQVLQVLHRICIVVLTIAVHTKTAEWVREDMVVICMPELVTVLVWFSIPFGLGVSTLDMYLLSKLTIAAMFVVLAYITSPAYDYKGSTRAMQACSISGCLTYFSRCMLQQWPGATPISEVPVKLLESFAQICFTAAVGLVMMSVGWGDFIALLIVSTIHVLSVVYLLMFGLLLGPPGYKRRFLRYLDRIIADGRVLTYFKAKYDQMLQGRTYIQRQKNKLD